jgi:hypothetical protein
MAQVGFEPTIQVFERTKAVYPLDRAATVIGLHNVHIYYNRNVSTVFIPQYRNKRGDISATNKIYIGLCMVYFLHSWIQKNFYCFWEANYFKY